MVDSEKLMEAITQAGYNLSSFADAIGMSRTTLWRKINGKGVFNLDEMQKCIKLLHPAEPRCIFLISEF